MSPPYARFTKLSDTKQEAILSAARHEFVTHGYEGTSLNQVISNAGISKGSFYYYFEDKLDLFITLLERVSDTGDVLERSQMMAAGDIEGFWAGLEHMLELSMEMTRAQPDLPRLGQAFASLSPQLMLTPRVAEFLGKMTAQLEALVSHGQALGAMREDIPMRVILEMWMGLDRVLDRWGLSQMGQDDEEALEQVWRVSADLFRRLFSQ